MARKIPKLLTRSDVIKICIVTSPASYSCSALISPLRPEFDKSLCGRTFTFSFEGDEKRICRFEQQAVLWGCCEESLREEYAEWFKFPNGEIYFVHHLKTNELPYEAVSFVLDLEKMSVTYIEMKLGTVHSNRDVQRTVKLGTVDGGECCKHEITNDLTGKVIDWKFADGVMMHHMYENISCSEFVSPSPTGPYEWDDFFYTFNPTKYIKVGEKLYLINFYAPGASGCAADMLMDLEKMTCVGAFFGIDSKEIFKSYTFGGKGAYADVAFLGRYTVE